MQYTFPANFWWGVALTANQTEGNWTSGGRTLSTWDHLYQEDPWLFEDMEHGPDKASDFYKTYKSDIAMARDMGLNTFRFTLSWSRMIPNGMANGVNIEAVNHYGKLIDEVIANGMEPFVALMCFDPPQYCMNGNELWERKGFIDELEYYATACFMHFGDRVKRWFTAVEAAQTIWGGYQSMTHPPFCSDFKRLWQAQYNFILAHSKCIRAYRRLGLDGDIGTIHVVYPVYPHGSQTEDIEAAKTADLFRNKLFLDAYIKGEIPKEMWRLWKEHDCTPEHTDEELRLISENRMTLLGLNYYNPMRVRTQRFVRNPGSPLHSDHFYETVAKSTGRTANGREVYEKGLYDSLIRIRDEYGNFPCYVSENGVRIVENNPKRNDMGEIIDDARIAFTKGHLAMISTAISEGCDCRGYHPFTLFDSWSWFRGYKYKYGFIEVDLDTMNRKFKKSGSWYREIIANGGFSL